MGNSKVDKQEGLSGVMNTIKYLKLLYLNLKDVKFGPHRRDLERHYKKVLRSLEELCFINKIDFITLCKEYEIKEL